MLSYLYLAELSSLTLVFVGFPDRDAECFDAQPLLASPLQLRARDL